VKPGLLLARQLAVLAIATAALVAVACAGGSAGDAATPPAREPASFAPEPPASEALPRIVVLGDSLTAGYGLVDPRESFPSQLQRRIDAAGLSHEVVNMGVSGDTSAGGLRRLDWALDGDVRVLVLALGANDGLRGLSTAQLEQNLVAMVDAAQKRGIDVLLCGMEAPPNFGEQYTRAFREVYPRVARARNIPLVPFLLEGVAGVSSLNQSDGIHPTADGARRIADLVWEKLEPMIDERQSR
jgi:acyl-CoA thioesterase-1